MVGVHGAQLAVGGDHVHRQDVVTGQPVLAVQPSNSAPESEAGDAGHGDHPKGGRQPEPRGGAVEFTQCQPGPGDGQVALWVDEDPLHRRHVERQPAVTHRVSRDRVSAALDREGQTIFSGCGHAVGDVLRIGALEDGRRPPFDHGVEHAACFLIPRVTRAEHRALHQLGQPFPQVPVRYGPGNRHDDCLPGRAGPVAAPCRDRPGDTAADQSQLKSDC